MNTLSLRHWAILMVVLLVALALRFAMLLQIEQNVDRAYPIWQALMTLDRGAFPILGQGTSVLFANPALTGYLFLPIVALTRSVVAVYAFVIVLNTFGILFAWRAVRSLFGSTAALIAAFLLAVNPWLIEYSRATWVQGLLPFFVPLIASLLIPVWMGTSRRPSARFIAASIALILCAQTYLLAYALIIPVAVLTLIYRKRLPMSAITIGALIVFVPSMLYASALLADPATNARIDSFADDQARFSLDAMFHALRLITGLDYAAARGASAPIDDSALRQTLSDGAHLVLLIGLVVGFFRALRSPRRDAAIIASVWFVLPIALMTYVGQAVHPFYQLIGLPAGAALTGYGIAWGVRRPTVPVLLVACAAFGLLMGVNSIRYAQETEALPGAHGLGALPLEVGVELGAAVRDNLVPGGRVYADVDEATLSSLAGITFDFWRETRAPLLVILPASGGLYVSMDQVPPTGAETAVDMPLVDGTRLRVDRFLPGAPLPDSFTSADIPGDYGLTFAGYSLTRQDGRIRVQTAWRVVDRDLRNLNLAFEHRMMMADSESNAVISFIDWAVVPGYLWAAGDLHIHEQTVDDPGEAYSVSVGQADVGAQLTMIFTLPDGTSSPTIPLE